MLATLPICLTLVSVGAIMLLTPSRAVIAQTHLDSPETNSEAQINQQFNSPNPKPHGLELPTHPKQVQVQEIQPMTLQQALALAERHSPELQVAKLTLQRSRAALQQVEAAQYPTIGTEVELGVERSAQERFNDLKYLGENSSPTAVLNGKVEANYDLFTFGRKTARIQAAQAQIRFDTLDIQRLEAQIRLEVANAYYDLQEAGEQVRIAQSAVTHARKSLSDAEALEQGGRGALFDVTRAKIQLANAEQELVQAQTQQEITSRQLAQLLKLGESADVAAIDPVQPAGQWDLPLADSIILAYNSRVELQQYLAQRHLSEQERQLALAEIKPQVGLFANYQVLDEFNEGLGLLDGFSIGARLRWNFFDAGASRAAAAQQDANRAIAEVHFTETRSQVRLQVERAYKTLQANAKNIQTAELAVAQAQDGIEVARLRFQAGVGTQLDVITAVNEGTRAEVNRVRAILNYNRSLAALQRAVSHPLTPVKKGKL